MLCIQLLQCAILRVPDSNLNPEASCPDYGSSWSSSVQGKCCDSTSDLGTHHVPGSATAQVVNYQLLMTEDQVQILARPRGIHGGQRGTGTGFCLSTWSSPINTAPPICHNHSLLHSLPMLYDLSN